jgi:gliding motility-associated-like protein
MGIRAVASLTLLLILSAAFSQAQNVAGVWLGVTYPANPNQATYNYIMTLTQTGNTLGGTAQTANPNVPFSGVAYISGQISGSALQFSEADQNGSTAVDNVCFWRGTMTYNAVDESLIGTYGSIVNGTTCIDASGGKVELYRIVLKSGATFCKGSPVNLMVTGKNIKWYASAAKTNVLATGNTYRPNITQTTTFYITQTLYQNESPAVPITITITEPVFKAMAVNTGCDKTNGSIEVVAAGATGWTYSLNGGVPQTSPVFTSLKPASYTLTATDTNGCTATQPVTITSDAAPTITSLQTTPPNCATANGEVSVIATGGKAPLTYSIDYGVTFQSNPLFTKLAGGAYTVRVRDANGCDVNRAVVLPPFTPMEILSTVVVPTSCGLPNGQVTMLISGGRKPVMYGTDSQTFQANPHFTALKAGSYTLTAKDSTGCTVSQPATVSGSTGPQIGDVETTPSACGEQTGTIQIEASANATTSIVDFSIDGQSFQQSPVFSGLKAGTYTLTLRDDKNCVVTQRIPIDQDCANRLYVPTAFSPNQDLMNDALTIHFGFASLAITSFTVYDRWGAVIYNRANFALSSGEPLWDGQINGKIVPAGMYAYQLDCLFPDGTPMSYRQPVALLY